MIVDYLVVGQGLAGSVLALTLLARGRSVVVADDAHRTAASLAAAGIINPITGRRLNRPHLISPLLERAFDAYPRMEMQVGSRFFERCEVRRLLLTAEEAVHWSRRRESPEYGAHLGAADAWTTEGEEVEGVRAPFGSFTVRTAARLDVPAFLEATAAHLRRRDALRVAKVRHEELRVSSEGVQWADLRARHVVFCEGYRLPRNPWFGAIALNPAKGELLKVAAPGFAAERIVQGGKWLFQSRREVLAGTTYRWDRLDEVPTALARAEILAGVRSFYPGPLEVLGQRAGVRPVTRADNRPFAGSHPRYPRLAVLNGLGSKGALQAPYVAERLIAKLEAGRYIDPEFDVCRECLWKGRLNA